MLGNDVVDLEDHEAAPSATHPRFDERVFAAEELRWLARSRCADSLRWMLWSAKESAFKAAKKLDGQTAFAPRAFVVRPESEDAGRVLFGDRVFAVRWTIDRSACHAVASAGLEPGAPIVSHIRRLAPEERSSSAVRRFAIDVLAPRIGVTAGDLEFVREGRVPRLRLRGAPLAVDVSLSHHGRYVAFAAARSP